MPKKRIRKPETRREQWQRENLIRSIEEITGVVREEWETIDTRNRTILRIRRIYTALMHILLKHSQWDIVDIYKGQVTQGYVNKSIQEVRRWVSEDTEHKAEIEAIIKNYEARPEYRFDTIA